MRSPSLTRMIHVQWLQTHRLASGLSGSPVIYKPPLAGMFLHPPYRGLLSIRLKAAWLGILACFCLLVVVMWLPTTSDGHWSIKNPFSERAVTRIVDARVKSTILVTPLCENRFFMDKWPSEVAGSHMTTTNKQKQARMPSRAALNST